VSCSRRVYETRVNSVDELKRRLVEVWHGLHQNDIDSAVDEWNSGNIRGRVRAKWQHFEHLLYVTEETERKDHCLYMYVLTNH